jgi:hypothetical protein
MRIIETKAAIAGDRIIKDILSKLFIMTADRENINIAMIKLIN